MHRLSQQLELLKAEAELLKKNQAKKITYGPVTHSEASTIF